MNLTGRLIMTVYMTALIALGWLLLPGNWRGLAVVPVFGLWAVWALPRPRGAHANRAGLGLTSPAPSPAGSSVNLYAPAAHVPVAGGPPWHTWSSTGADGLWDAGKAEIWPGHDDPYYLPEDAGAGWPPPKPPAPVPDSTGPGASSSLTPGPVEPSTAWLNRVEAEIRSWRITMEKGNSTP